MDGNVIQSQWMKKVIVEKMHEQKEKAGKVAAGVVVCAPTVNYNSLIYRHCYQKMINDVEWQTEFSFFTFVVPHILMIPTFLICS